MRVLADERLSAAAGLAGDEALMLHYGRGESAASDTTLRLYTYRPHCALVGRYQALDAEVDLEACRSHGVEVGRRPTGGGAIIMGPGQLGVAITTRAPAGPGPRDLLRRYAEGIVAGLASLGVEARFQGKNDLQVGGRKIAGLGLYVDDRGALLFHASVLADLDVELMLEVLRIPGAKLADKGVERVQERITTVSREAGRTMAGDDLREAIAAGFGVALEADGFEADGFDARERALADQLVARHTSAEWLAGRAVPGQARGTSALKTPAGFIRVYAGVQNGALSSVLLAGDFSAMPPSLLALESALKWCRADRARISEIVAAEQAGDELGIEPDALADAILAAAERAAGAAPLRPAGSCYFPEAA